MRTCTRCGDTLLDDYPGATTCREWSLARQASRGDMLTEDEAMDCRLVAGLCAISVALRDGAEMVDFDQ